MGLLDIFKNQKPGDKEKSKVISEIGPYLHLGWQMAITIALGTLAGWYIDKEYDSSPTYTLIFTMLGVIVGMYSFFKTVLSIEKKKKKQKDK